MAKHCLKASRNQNLRQEICPHLAVKVWWEPLEICWMCSSTCCAHIQCQTSTTIASLHLWGATWWPNIAWKWAENWVFSWSEAWNLPTSGCKSMTEGLTIVLGVFITYWYTPIQWQTTTTLASLHLWGATWWPNIAWKWAEIGIWGMKPANKWL